MRRAHVKRGRLSRCLAIAPLLAGATACGPRVTATTDQSLAMVRARGELLWGGDIQGGAPFASEDPADPTRLVGFEVDLAAAVAGRLGVHARFVQCAWSNLIPSLERGDFDVVLNGLEATDERRARLLLSRPYYVYGETLAVQPGSPLRFLDLAGRRVGTLNQTYAHDLLRRLGADPVLYEGVQEPYLDLGAGRIDAVLLEDVIADRYGCGRPGVECVPGAATLGTYVVGMRRGDRALARAIDDALDAVSANGQLRDILERAGLWNARQQSLRPAIGRTTSATIGRAQLGLFVRGALVTLALSVAAFLLAVPLGLGLATMRLYGLAAGRALAAGYVELFRGTPVLLQLYVLYFALAPLFRLGAATAAVLGLGLNYAAYEAEIYRGAITAVPRAQGEAARALGLTRAATLRHVLLPQALRIALPAMTNDFVALLKDSSVVSVITVVELTKRMTIAAVDLNDWLLPGAACAALYFLMSFPLAQLARALESRFRVDPRPQPV